LSVIVLAPVAAFAEVIALIKLAGRQSVSVTVSWCLFCVGASSGWIGLQAEPSNKNSPIKRPASGSNARRGHSPQNRFPVRMGHWLLFAQTTHSIAPPQLRQTTILQEKTPNSYQFI
jgi:hypothetical protein